MEIFKIGNCSLDEYQKKVVLDESKSLLVVAGAGSGKTFTVLAKVKYLIEVKRIKQNEILLLSLTNDTVNNLKDKLNSLGYRDMNVYTFHKLGLNIIKNCNAINLVSEDYLDFIIDEYFMSYIFNNRNYRRKIIKYFRINIFKDLNKNKEYILFKKGLIRTIHLIKNRNYNINFIYEIYKKKLIYKFLWKILLDILVIYKRELESFGLIDFDDMINTAYSLLKNKKVFINYKYIIIDEFQDISFAKYKMIKEIIDMNNAHFMAVGDDWQSIYGFTGCEVDILINFKNYFNASKILFLKNTYRNSQELINVASSFILKNPYQIKKELFSYKHCYKPIKIIYSSSKDIILRLLKHIDSKDIMVLGRNNYDINNYYINNNTRYLTVHKSKGLESDNVILINLENKVDGFPNKKRDDLYLRDLNNRRDDYKYSEERRLFYVALTRTKNYIYLIVNKQNKSLFIKELLKNFKNYIEILYI